MSTGTKGPATSTSLAASGSTVATARSAGVGIEGSFSFLSATPVSVSFADMGSVGVEEESEGDLGDTSCAKVRVYVWGSGRMERAARAVRSIPNMQKDST